MIVRQPVTIDGLSIVRRPTAAGTLDATGNAKDGTA